jgi:hypothetical protein
MAEWNEKYHNSTSNTSVELSTPTELMIANFSSVEESMSFIDKFSPILLAIQFTSLFISNSNFTVETFVRIIELLPNLDSLQVFHLSLQNKTILTDEDAESLRPISVSNKIRRVWLSMESELMDFLINLCSCMEYLQVRSVENNDLEELVRAILQKHNTHICHLHSLCFHVDDANDQVIYDLEKIIDSERLLCDYSIQRKCNDIFLQWNVQ